jgi:hypothetical protein
MRRARHRLRQFDSVDLYSLLQRYCAEVLPSKTIAYAEPTRDIISMSLKDPSALYYLEVIADLHLDTSKIIPGLR